MQQGGFCSAPQATFSIRKAENPKNEIALDQVAADNLRPFAPARDILASGALHLGGNRTLNSRRVGNGKPSGGICEQALDPSMPCTTTSTPSYPRLMGARSRHPGGLNAAMCDGSVHFFSFAVWQALGSSKGGEALDSSAF